MKTTEKKNLLLAELKAHEIADEFVRGTWLADDGVKGCFYGCTMKTDSEPREKFAKKYDIDLWYCYLTEKIFENLPGDQFKSFPYDSINIIPLNFDFNVVKSEWNKAMLLKQLDWITDEKVRKVLLNTAKLFYIPFNEIDKEAAWSAESAAWSAESAAWSAESAARSAESAAGSAAWSAAESAARSAQAEWLRNNTIPNFDA